MKLFHVLWCPCEQNHPQKKTNYCKLLLTNSQYIRTTDPLLFKQLTSGTSMMWIFSDFAAVWTRRAETRGDDEETSINIYHAESVRKKASGRSDWGRGQVKETLSRVT